MTNRSLAGGIILVGTLSLGACSAYGTGPREYSLTNDTGVGATTETAGGTVAGSKDRERAKGGTSSGASGATSASTPAPAGPGEKPEQRGNTPPGVSRDGQGPLGGAIVDPTGSVTKGK